MYASLSRTVNQQNPEALLVVYPGESRVNVPVHKFVPCERCQTSSLLIFIGAERQTNQKADGGLSL